VRLHVSMLPVVSFTLFQHGSCRAVSLCLLSISQALIAVGQSGSVHDIISPVYDRESEESQKEEVRCCGASKVSSIQGY
jgi:hypothetical protein